MYILLYLAYCVAVCGFLVICCWETVSLYLFAQIIVLGNHNRIIFVYCRLYLNSDSTFVVYFGQETEGLQSTKNQLFW